MFNKIQTGSEQEINGEGEKLSGETLVIKKLIKIMAPENQQINFNTFLINRFNLEI